ncbi:hypothetical protein [Streptomyces sp. 029-5]|uniref:hypothetical protein n=1 Tax=Streptomyces sp. 029-5 TaxID=2789261 RepID=UPI00397FA1A9
MRKKAAACVSTCSPLAFVLPGRLLRSPDCPDPTTTLVVGHWNYLGSGYSPGAVLLTAGVWHRKELERQFAAEGGC